MVIPPMRRPWARPARLNSRGRWIWALCPRRTAQGRKWMCWLWREPTRRSPPVPANSFTAFTPYEIDESEVPY